MHACHGRGNAAADKIVVHGRGRHGGRHGGRGGRTVRASSDSDGDEERDAADLESAIAEGGLEKVLPSDGAESERHEPGSGSADADDAPEEDGVDDDDGANVGQLTAIAQRLARDQRVQRGKV
eukprot:363631-Chlamydomonas_euryale.AAC.16